MKIAFPLLIVAASLFIGGCRDFTLLSDQDLARYAPDTVKRFHRIADIPGEVPAAVAADLGCRELKDRSAYWTGGCSAGAQLLEAGERKHGWWVFYRLGGIVDSKRLAMVERRDGKLVVASTAILR